MLAVAVLGPRAAFAGGPLPAIGVCVDSSSPSAVLDARIARAALRAVGSDARIISFDGSYGIVERYFRYLARKDCRLVMGFPVDIISPDPPAGLALTQAYAHTGYVLAMLGSKPLSSLPPESKIGVGMATAPNFYVVGALGSNPPYKADTFQSQEAALDALMHHTDPAAMVWKLSFVRYRAAHPAAAAVHISHLGFPHAAWDLAALYDPKGGTEAARTFERGLSLLQRSGMLQALTKPAVTE